MKPANQGCSWVGGSQSRRTTLSNSLHRWSNLAANWFAFYLRHPEDLPLNSRDDG
jgi:hypothetical protein